MADQAIDDLVCKAEDLYHRKLQALLEPLHRHKFVAIEPESGDYFLGTTLSEAIGASRQAHPNRLAHAMRVGHRAALHFGLKIR